MVILHIQSEIPNLERISQSGFAQIGHVPHIPRKVCLPVHGPSQLSSPTWLATAVGMSTCCL
jgi:hypothetical protein